MSLASPESLRPLPAPTLTLLASLMMAMGSAAVRAQEAEPAAPAQAQSLQTRVGLSQSWTDNLRLSPSGSKDAAMVTTVTPGVTWSSRAGWLQGSLDYALNGVAYVKTTQGSQLQNSLSANLKAELLRSHLFVDSQASIGRQSQSAFGVQSTTPLINTANSQEVANLTVSPYLVGSLAGRVSYELRGSLARVDARGSTLGDSRTHGGTLRLSSLGGGPLSLSGLLSTQQVSYPDGRANQNDSLTLSASYRLDADWNFSLTGGRERNDYQGGSAITGSTYGGSLSWTPSARTSLAADWRRHSYGDSHSLTLQQRWSRTVLVLSDTTNLNLGNSGGSGGIRTVYDQFYLLFASLEPDPIKRDALVRSYLQQLGLSPDAPAAGGFLNAGPSRLHSQQLSLTLQGVRGSLTFVAMRNLTSRVGSNAGQGDLAQSSLVEQRSYSLSAAHRLTPEASLSLSLARQETDGDANAPSTQLTTYSLSFNTRLAPRLSCQLGGRHSRFDGSSPYVENALFANLTQQF